MFLTLPYAFLHASHPGGEVLAEALPGTHVFKAFNTVPDHLMEVRAWC